MTNTVHHKNLIDGRAIADAWLGDIAVQIHALGTTPHLAAVAVEPDEGLRSFIMLKQKAAQRCGIMFSSYLLEAKEADTVSSLLAFLAADEQVHGIFVELPLPEHLDTDAVLAHIPERKDIDRLSPDAERLFYGGISAPVPPAVRAVERTLQTIGMEPDGISAAVIGQGRLIGKPVAHWLTTQGARVSVVDVNTREPAAVVRQAELVVSGTGVPGLVTGDWVADGATILDFGYTKQDDMVFGDVEATSVLPRAGALTPVPGGMGPLVIAATLDNLLTLALAA
jgi:methylenetetrahydrofolate dehydrogenase (NADP+)/methenyltetrahydrofolate cyclohydrolase